MQDFDVTVTRIGTVRIKAENATHAMEIINQFRVDAITWLDDFTATDATPVDNDQNTRKDGQIMTNGKNIVISCGPIPARLDSVKFITNRFKGGLAVRTASQLAKLGHDVTIVAWKYTDIPTDIMAPESIEKNGKTITYPGVRKVVRVADVFEYYDWFVANAKNYDAFVMAAAVANLTPVKPYEGKFPSHNYKPGDEFDIKFMIAPRAIDAIKTVNPRACLIGYKLFDEPDDNKLIDIARHTLADAKANIIFANRPSDAKTRKIAVTADNSAFECNFDEHVELIDRAIRQEYFRTEIQPFTEDETNDPEILTASGLVSLFEQTFNTFGTVAIPVNDGMFMTTARGHKNGPVLVRSIDYENHIIYASAKATLNAPALGKLVDKNHYVVHRHLDDPRYVEPETSQTYTADKYIMPGTVEEVEYMTRMRMGNFDHIMEPYHGVISRLKFEPVNWPEYHNTFPPRYFNVTEVFQNMISNQIQKPGAITLEIGGNRHPDAMYSYDPYVKPETKAIPIELSQLLNMRIDFAFSRNAICYLTEDEIKTILAASEKFMANAPAHMPNFKISANEVAVKIEPDETGHQRICHYLLLDNDRIMRHTFYAYDEDFYTSLGLTVTQYGRNSALITKNIDL